MDFAKVLVLFPGIFRVVLEWFGAARVAGFDFTCAILPTAEAPVDIHTKNIKHLLNTFIFGNKLRIPVGF